MARALAPTDAADAAAGKGNFANRAYGFASRVRNLTGLPIYVSASVAAILIVTVAGGFGTGAMPLPTRLAFWTMLIGFNALLWVLWLAWRVRSDSDWWRAVAAGMLVLNLPIPLEIRLALRLVGGGEANAWGDLWMRAGAISAAVLLVLFAALRGRSTEPPADFAKGRLWRAGFTDAAEIAAIASEDHYCRVWRRGGTNVLIHARFRDLIEEVAASDGVVLRRGQWVAASAVASVTRGGRRWVVTLGDGRSLPVSSSAAADLRARGWVSGGAGGRSALRTAS